MTDFVEVDRKQNRATAHAGCGSGGFAPGMTCADDGDVVK
jgi:hypothetical protein